MPTVADEFIVKLSVDGSGISKGAKDAEKSVDTLKKGTKEAGEASKKAGKDGADAFAAFRREAVGALALFTGGKSLAGFTKDITEANTALGNLSKQLDIAPQKLTQMRYAVRDTGGNENSVDSMFSGLQEQGVTQSGRNRINNNAWRLGVDVFRPDGHVRADLLDQIAHSKVFQSQSRAIQNDFISQLNGNSDIATLVTSQDYDKIKERYANKGPTKEQIAQAQQLRSDWTQLQAETDQIMQKAFSDAEPSLHNWVQALIAFEKAHPDAIAHGVEAVAAALTLLSAALTARGIASMIKLATGIKGGGGGLGLGTAGIIIGATASAPIKGDDKEAIADGEEYEKVVKHYKNRTGAWTTWDFDEAKERGLMGLPPASEPPSNAASSPDLARGERNNNPGNLNFAGQRGAHLEAGSNGRFAAFNTPEDGLSALKNQLTLYNTRDHLDTVSDIISKYAPASDNNHTADYIEAVAQKLHAGKDQHLGKLSPAAMAAIMHGIIGVENGHDRYGGMVERIAGLSNIASSASAQNTTHTTTNTTHAPNINVTVHSSQNPHETAQAIHQKLSENLYAGNLHQVI